MQARGRAWWLVAMMLALGVAACSGSGSETDATVVPDTAAEAAADTVSPPDAAVDPGTDVPADPGTSPDTVDAASDARPDVDWAALPHLPAGKTFTTRYAAGAARTDVSPDHSVPMGGFGFCAGSAEACRWSEGVHDPVQASAAALADTQTGEVVVFVGVDSTGLLRPDIDDIHEAAQWALYDAYGVYVEGPRVVVSATHAHSAPDVTGLWGPNANPRDEAYVAYLKAQAVAAAVQAFGALADAKLDWAKSSAPTNDDDTFGSDDEIYVLRARTPSNDPIFLLTRWPAHPTCYGSENNAISSDWVGVFRKLSEEAHGGLSVFMQGPIGSVYPERGAPVVPCDGPTDLFPEGYQDPDVDNHQTATCVGRNVANQVTAALQAPTPVPETGLVFRTTTFEFHPTNLAFMALAKIGQIAIEYVDTKDPSSKMMSTFSWITLGDLDYLTMPGEAFPSFAAAGAAELKAAGSTTVITLGLAQDWMGYLLTNEGWAEDNDETAYHKGLSPSSELEDPFLQALEALINP
jgi:hypothetical protein